MQMLFGARQRRQEANKRSGQKEVKWGVPEKHIERSRDNQRQVLGLPQQLQQQVGGINSAVQIYTVSPKGQSATPSSLNPNGSLWQLNFSTIPGQQKRLVSINDASTFLINYAQQEYPSRIDILIDQIPGALDQDGNSSHSVATLVPKGPSIPVYNAGGITGYNVAYGLLGDIKAWDISTLPTITFNLTVGNDRIPCAYPLAQPLALLIQVTRVIF